MTRRKKKRPEEIADAPTLDGAPVGTSLRGLLAEISIAPPREPGPSTKRANVEARASVAKRAREKPASTPAAAPASSAASHSNAAPAPEGRARPSETLRGEDRIAFHQAMAGVRPVARAVAPEPIAARVSAEAKRAREEADEEVRARLAALVAGEVRFDLAQDGSRILGRRGGLPLRVADDLSLKQVVPEATLDLHGERGADADGILSRWLRAQHRRGALRVCVVHGKGLHSEGGQGVLRERVVRVLTEGSAASLVRAFASAHASHGGTGALMVELVTNSSR